MSARIKWAPMVGGFGGLLFGLSYWFAWGCRACAKGSSPVAIVLFCVAMGAAMAYRWAPRS